MTRDRSRTEIPERERPSGVKLIWNKHAGTILVHLRMAEEENRPVIESEIRFKITRGSPDTAKTRLEELRGLGLVTSRRMGQEENAHEPVVWSLTSKGGSSPT